MPRFLGESAVSEDLLASMNAKQRAAQADSLTAQSAASDDDPYQVYDRTTGDPTPNPEGHPGAVKSAQNAAGSAVEAAAQAALAAASAAAAGNSVANVVGDAPTVEALRGAGGSIRKVPTALTRYNKADSVHSTDRVGFGWPIGVNSADANGGFNLVYTLWRVTAGSLQKAILYVLDNSVGAANYATWKSLPILHTQEFDLYHNTKEIIIPFSLSRMITEQLGGSPKPLGIHITFIGENGLKIRPVVDSTVGGGFFVQDTGTDLAGSSGTLANNEPSYILARHELDIDKKVLLDPAFIKALEQNFGGNLSKLIRQGEALDSIVPSGVTVEGSVVEPVVLEECSVGPTLRYSISTKIDLTGKPGTNNITIALEADPAEDDIEEVEVVAYQDVRTLVNGVIAEDHDSSLYGIPFARGKKSVNIPSSTVGIKLIEVPINLGNDLGPCTLVLSSNVKCHWVGKSGVAGAAAYTREDDEAAQDGLTHIIGHPNPLSAMGNLPIANSQIYVKAEKLIAATAEFSATSGLQVATAALPKAVANSVRFRSKARRAGDPAYIRFGQNTYTWRVGSLEDDETAEPFTPLVQAVCNIGASIAQSTFWRDEYLDRQAVLFPNLDLAPGWWDVHQDEVPQGNVTRTFRSGLDDAYNILTNGDDGRYIGPGCWTQRWNVGAEERWEFSGVGIGRFFILHDRGPGGHSLEVRDRTNGDILLGTADLSDASGSGPALFVVEMPLGPREISVKCIATGSSSFATRTLAYAGDFGVDANGRLVASAPGRGILLLGSFGKGSTNIDDGWSDAIEDGRVFSLWNVSNGIHKVHPPDLIRFAIGTGDTMTPSTITTDQLIYLREHFSRAVAGATKHSISTWENWEGLADVYPSDQLWGGYSDFVGADRRGLGAVAIFEGFMRAEKAENVSFVNFIDWGVYGSADALGLTQDGTHPNAAGAQIIVDEELRLALLPGMLI